jgi:GNAT superfamily N-acetyltransferase
MASEPVFSVEKYADVIAEAKPLLVAHWEEVALFKDRIKLAPDFDKYEQMEKVGGLHICTVRVDGRMVGYHVAIVSRHPHYMNDIFSLTDIFFVAPDYRRGQLGLDFFRFIENEMKKLGVSKMMAGTKLHRDLDIMFRRLGWSPTDRMYAKCIGE